MLLLVAAVAAIAVPAAVAKRAPTATEAKAIRAAVKAYIQKPGSPAAPDNRVRRIRVSTVDVRYALVTLNSASAGPSQMGLRKRSSGWKVIAFGSDLGCEFAPAGVVEDLLGVSVCLARPLGKETA